MGVRCEICKVSRATYKKMIDNHFRCICNTCTENYLKNNTMAFNKEEKNNEANLEKDEMVTAIADREVTDEEMNKYLADQLLEELAMDNKRLSKAIKAYNLQEVEWILNKINPNTK